MNKFFSLLCFTFLLSTQVFASGLSKPVLVGPKAIGMGGAFVGVADDPTAIFHNPAGMTQMKGHQIELGIDSLISDEEYTPPGGATESADHQLIPVPQFGYVNDLFRPLSVGLGVFFPHGNGGKFDSASAVITNPNEGRIYSMEISPAFAWELFDGLSVGASVRFVRVSSSLKGQLFVLDPTTVPPGTDTLDDLDVSGWGVGMAAGIFYRPCKFFSFGVNYRSNVDVTVEGTAKFAATGSLPASYDQALPTLFTAGFAYHPTDPLTLAFSYDFERNSEIDQLNVVLGGNTFVLPENYSDSHTIHLGGEYLLTPAWALRIGYAKDLNDSIPDSVMNRIIGDIAAHEVSVGGAYKWSRYTISGAWNGRFGQRDIPVTASNVAPGHYDAFVNELSMGLQISL